VRRTALRNGDLLAPQVGQRLDRRVLGHDDVLCCLGRIGTALHGNDFEAELLGRAGDRRDVANRAEVDIAGGCGLHERWAEVEPGELHLVRCIVEHTCDLGQLLAAVASVVTDGEGVLTPLRMASRTGGAQWGLRRFRRGTAGGGHGGDREQCRGAEISE
jgi:hypothetical protein